MKMDLNYMKELLREIENDDKPIIHYSLQFPYDEPSESAKKSHHLSLLGDMKCIDIINESRGHEYGKGHIHILNVRLLAGAWEIMNKAIEQKAKIEGDINEIFNKGDKK